MSCKILTLLPPNLPILSSAILPRLYSPSGTDILVNLVLTLGSLGINPGKVTSSPLAILALANFSTSVKNSNSLINLF